MYIHQINYLFHFISLLRHLEGVVSALEQHFQKEERGRKKMQPIPTETKGANRNIWGSFTGRRKTFTSEDLRRACHGLFIKLISKGSVENVKTHFFRAVGSGSFWWENVKIRQGAKRARFPSSFQLNGVAVLSLLFFLIFFFLPVWDRVHPWRGCHRL